MKKIFFTILIILLVVGAFFLGKNFEQKDSKENNKVTDGENNESSDIGISSTALKLFNNFKTINDTSAAALSQDELGFDNIAKFLFSKDKITRDDLTSEFKIAIALENINYDSYETIVIDDIEYYSVNRSTVDYYISRIFGEDSKYDLVSFLDSSCSGGISFKYDSKKDAFLIPVPACGAVCSSLSSSYKIKNSKETNDTIEIEFIYGIIHSYCGDSDSNGNVISSINKLYRTPNGDLIKSLNISTEELKNKNLFEEYINDFNTYKYTFKKDSSTGEYYFESFEKIK